MITSEKNLYPTSFIYKTLAHTKTRLLLSLRKPRPAVMSLPQASALTLRIFRKQISKTPIYLSLLSEKTVLLCAVGERLMLELHKTRREA